MYTAAECKEFYLTQEHIDLLKRTYVEWQDCETGAPAIGCKRPYGNSDVAQDIREILRNGMNDDEALELHKETQTALQIILSTSSFVPGLYVSNDICHRQWALTNIY